MEKITKEEQDKIVQNCKDIQDRILKKLKKRMKDLSKDKKLKEQTEKELYESFNNST